MRWDSLFDQMEQPHIAIDRTNPVAHNQAQKVGKGLMSTKIGAYARISLDMDGEGLGVERQHEDNRAVAKFRGWTITDEYTDNSLSAYKKDVIRPEFERLVADLESGVIDGVVAYDLDRLWRKPSDLERVIALYDEGERRPFATVQGDYDLSTSDGRAMARVLVAFANKASEDTSRRLKRRNLQLAQAGRAKSGPQPYGYTVDQSVVDSVEGPIVHDMGMKMLAGLTYSEITESLNERGIKRRDGSRWIPQQVIRLLTNPRNAGLRELHGVVYEGSWQPIFTREEWEAMQHVIRLRKERALRAPTSRHYLLTGMLRCGKCGAYLHGMTKRDRPGAPLRTTYQCPSTKPSQPGSGCGGITVSSVGLEHLVREALCYRLDREGIGAALAKAADADAKMHDLVAERGRVVLRKEALTTMFVDEILSRSDFVHQRERLDQRIEDIDRVIASQHQAAFKLGVKPGESVREAWIDRTNGWRRSIAETLIDSITIRGSRKRTYYEADEQRVMFDPERVDIRWKR